MFEIFYFALHRPRMTPERENRIRNVIAKRQRDITVIFENVHDPHNISAVLRTCDSIGVKEVFILYTHDNKMTRLGKKSSASALKWLQVHYYYNTEECFAEVRKKYKKIFSTKLTENSSSLYELNLTGSVALVFGNEHEGVSALASSLSDGNFLIPQVGMIQSLNISVACAVTLYEAFRQREKAGMYDTPQLGAEESMQLLTKWLSESR